MRTKQEHKYTSRRILYLWLPNFSIERFLLNLNKKPNENLNNRGLVLTRAVHSRRMVTAVCPLAAKLGIVIGCSLNDALALDSNLMVAETNPSVDRIVITGLADWCLRYTPFVALDTNSGETGGSGIWLDITGCAHLFGGETALLNEIIFRFGAFGWTARAAISDTPGTAWAVARFNGSVVKVIETGEQLAAISDFPLTALRLSSSVVEGLERVGLRRISQLISIARSPLTARFGSTLMNRLDQALGIKPEPISPRIPHFPYCVRFVLPEPILLKEDITRITQQLIVRLIQRLMSEDRCARRLRLIFYRVDGEVRKLTIGTSRINCNSNVILQSFSERFNQIDLGFGVDVISLEALVTNPLVAHQTVLDITEKRKKLENPDLLDRLVNRFGSDAVIRVSRRKSYIPEKAEIRVPVISESFELEDQDQWFTQLSDPIITRPLRLLRQPERVHAIALVPDHPPKRFWWRGAEVQIGNAIGPERIGPEWWRRQDQYRTRDYFRVEDLDGRRYWLFREGLAERGEALIWFVHGLFA